METTIERVTPKKATAWLNKNVGNRSLRTGVVEKYAADMKAGRWTACTASIAFYDDDEVADGQHRLFAIIESDTIQEFIIVRGVPRDAGLNIDTGAGRTVVDNARISGLDPGLSMSLVSAARAIHEGVRSVGPRSNAQKLDVVNRYREAAEFAAAHCPRAKFLGNGLMLGAIGRAYMHEADKDRLLRFCSVLRTGFMDNQGESAAVAIRNHLLSKAHLATASTMWVDTFWKCQNAIHSFMRGRPLQWIKVVKAEPYPLLDPASKPLKGQRKANGSTVSQQQLGVGV